MNWLIILQLNSLSILNFIGFGFSCESSGNELNFSWNNEPAFDEFRDDFECFIDYAHYLNFTLFTPEDATTGYALNDSNVLEAPFKPQAITTIITHGWHSAGNSSWLTEMKDKYLETSINNVVIIDWGFYAKANYIAVMQEIPKIGVCVAEMMIVLIESHLIDADQVHVIGHSMGAHIAGVIGKTIQMKLNVTIGRITALDAAKPGFSDETFEWLTHNDAQLVDAIHTDGDIFGIDEPFAHVDFYPNGGTGNQPGCHSLDVFCSHARAYEFYLESIDSESFIAKKCSSYEEFESGGCADEDEATMGLYTNSWDSGTFFLKTNDQSPYALGKTN